MRKQYFGNKENADEREFIIFDNNEIILDLVAEYFTEKGFNADAYEDCIHVTIGIHNFVEDFKAEFNKTYKEVKQELKGL